jgi:DNA-nicking Smr family endonuclease
VHPDTQLPGAWEELDNFVVAARDRKLNILFQAPVVGGNAGGPPRWAGRREAGKSAPANMAALIDFAGKLAKRYCPGGTLAQAQGWGSDFGVRAWELDNEPESYFTHWKGQAADYAEFVTGAAQRIKAADPQAVIVGPGLAAGRKGLTWLEAALDAERMSGSPMFRQSGTPYSIGPSLDAVSFHNYEGLDSLFAKEERTIVQVFDDVRAMFEKWENRSPEFGYARKQEYWHTEGNFDFLGIMSQERRAAWRWQFFARAFSAGVRRVCVMDASKPEQIAVRTFTEVLPDPFPMLEATHEIQANRGEVVAFKHPEGPDGGAGTVWVIWARAGTGDGQVIVPVNGATVQVRQVDGRGEDVPQVKGEVVLELKGDRKMAPPVMVIDRSK